MNKLTILFMFLLSISYVYALSDEINLSEDVSNQTTTINISLTQNQSIFVDLIDYDSRLSYIYPKQVDFGNNIWKEVNFTVGINGTFTTNETINSTFKITNDINNITHYYNLISNIEIDPRVSSTEHFFINILNGDYVINISQNLIPKAGDLSYDIEGRAGEQLNISCDEGWIICPQYATFDGNNKTYFKIHYSIPDDASVGKHIYNATFKTGNVTIEKSIIFNIQEPDIIFQDYELSEDCIISLGDNKEAVKMECYIEADIFNKKRVAEMYDYFKRTNQINCSPEIETEYVFVGDVEEDVRISYKTCQDDLGSCRSDYDSLSGKVVNFNKCTEELKIANNRLKNEETECLESVFQTSVKLKQDAEQFKNQTMIDAKKYRRKTYGGLVIIIVVILFIIGGLYYKNAVKEARWKG